MTESNSRERTRDRVREHRKKLRTAGLRPVQFWLPDVNTPQFAAEAHRQSLDIAQSAYEREDQDFIDSVSDSGLE